MTNKHIVNVEYRHALPTAYVQVVGFTERAAERNAKQVCMKLQENLPEAVVQPPRPRGIENGYHLFEVPVSIIACEEEARAFLATLVLKGAA